MIIYFTLVLISTICWIVSTHFAELSEKEQENIDNIFIIAILNLLLIPLFTVVFCFFNLSFLKTNVILSDFKTALNFAEYLDAKIRNSRQKCLKTRNKGIVDN